MNTGVLKMWSTYKTESDAIAYLTGEGFKWNESRQQWQRGEPFISLCYVTIGQSRNGQWLITHAPLIGLDN